MRYVVESVDDLAAADDIRTKVVEHASKESNPDSFICCILAHGKEGVIEGLDGSTVKIADISRGLDCQSIKTSFQNSQCVRCLYICITFQTCLLTRHPSPTACMSDHAFKALS